MNTLLARYSPKQRAAIEDFIQQATARFGDTGGAVRAARRYNTRIGSRTTINGDSYARAVSAATPNPG